MTEQTPPPNLALWDMDGTLSNDLHRHALYVSGKATEYWDRDKMLADTVWPQAREAFNELQAAGWRLGILSARLHDLNYDVTREWLEKNGFSVNFIILRTEKYKDIRPPQFKSSVVQTFIESGRYNSVVLYDNDEDVIARVAYEAGAKHVVFCDWERTEGDPT